MAGFLPRPRRCAARSPCVLADGRELPGRDRGHQPRVRPRPGESRCEGLPTLDLDATRPSAGRRLAGYGWHDARSRGRRRRQRRPARNPAAGRPAGHHARRKRPAADRGRTAGKRRRRGGPQRRGPHPQRRGPAQRATGNRAAKDLSAATTLATWSPSSSSARARRSPSRRRSRHVSRVRWTAANSRTTSAAG